MDQLQHTFYLVALFVFGLIFGSFGNVVIWRLPRRESLSRPGSRCPSCGHPIRWHDNLPVLSWLVLRARCRDCGAAISARYPVVELLSGVAWVLAGLVFGLSWRAAAAVALFYLLLLLAAIDLDTMRLPNPLVAIVGVVGLAGAVAAQLTGVPVVPLTDPAGPGLLAQPLASALLGCVLGIGVMGLIGLAYGLVRGQAGMGMGDYKLLAAAGLFLGPYVLVALMLGSLLSVLAVPVLSRRRGGGPMGQRRFPFGPFLAAGVALAAVVGPAIVGWYLRILGGG